MIHDAHGWWVREAGPPPVLPPPTGDGRADVVVVGGGYLGLWTAWHLLDRAPNARVVVLEAARCGFGPSGRNGGFVTGYWGKLDALVESFGEAEGLRLARAAQASVDAIGTWAQEQGVDCWWRRVGELEVASAPGQEGTWEAAVSACERLGPPGEYRALDRKAVGATVRSPVFGAGALLRSTATVQPARLAFGLRERLRERGAVVHEHARVTRLVEHPGEVRAVVGGAVVSAPVAVVAVNHATGVLRPFARMVATASSHIVLTRPVPDVLRAVGWTDGTSLCDARTMLHYFRTTADDRIAFGWGGGRMALGTRRRARLDVDPEAARRATAALERFFPPLRGAGHEAAWGGPIDVSPTRLPQFRTAGPRVIAGFGFTGNGVGPAHLGGRILAAMALGARDELTSLPLVEPVVRRFPPEPLRALGGSVIRAALVRADDDADAGRRSALPVRAAAGLPRRLGLHLPR